MNPAIKTGANLAKFARPQNVVYSGLVAIVVARLAGAGWTQSVICYLLFLALYALAAGINNIVDRQVDVANQRADNPLTGRALSKPIIGGFFAVQLLIILLIQTVLQQPASGLLCMAYLALLLAYSLPWPALQRRGFLATISLALCYGSLPVTIGAAQGIVSTDKILLLCAAQLILLTPLLLAKDYKDLAGDRLHGKATPLVRYGKSGIILACYVCLGMLAAGLLYLTASASMTIILGLSAVVYTALVLHIHRQDGRRPLLVTRLCQLALLLITWQLFEIL